MALYETNKWFGSSGYSAGGRSNCIFYRKSGDLFGNDSAAYTTTMTFGYRPVIWN